MRILFFPNYRHAFEYRILDGLSHALRQLGHDTHISWRPAHSHIVSQLAHDLKADVVFQVNRPRPIDDLFPTTTKHISWYQDCRIPAMKKANAQAKKGDIIYYMHDVEALTGQPFKSSIFHKLLAPAVDLRRVNDIETSLTNNAEELDFSIIGNINPPHHIDQNEDTLAEKGQLFSEYWAWYQRKNSAGFANWKYLFNKIKAKKKWKTHYQAVIAKTVMETHFSPLDGVSDYAGLNNLLDKFKDLDNGAYWKTEDAQISYLRLLNRVAIARYILDLSTNVSFYGANWDQHVEFKKYAGGFLHHHAEMMSLYHRTKIIIHDNPDGCNFHDRVLYAMASGRFLMAGSSKWDGIVGGFGTAFKAGIHYGAYTHDNFHEQAKKWLCDDEARKKIGKQARKEILKNHNYLTRATQILNDLENAK